MNNDFFFHSSNQFLPNRKKKLKIIWELTGLIATVWVIASFVFSLSLFPMRGITLQNAFYEPAYFPDPIPESVDKEIRIALHADDSIASTVARRMVTLTVARYIFACERTAMSNKNNHKILPKTIIAHMLSADACAPPMQIFWKIGFELHYCRQQRTVALQSTQHTHHMPP